MKTRISTRATGASGNVGEAIFFFRRPAAPGTKSNARDDHGQRTTVPYPRPLSGHAGRRAKRGVVQAHRQGAPSDSGESGPLRPPRLRTGLQEVPRGSRTGGEPKDPMIVLPKN